MSFNFGQRIKVDSFVRGVQLSADGFPKAKAGGVKFDWSSVAALAKDTYLSDQLNQDGVPGLDARAIPKDSKVVRFGTPISRKADGTFELAQTGSFAKGDLYLVNETVVLAPGAEFADREPIAIDGGRVFKARVLSSDTADAASDISGAAIGKDVDGAAVSVTGLPTLAEIEAALPTITYALD